MHDESLTWLEILTLAESRIEDLFVGGRKYMPSILAVNRELRNLALCQLDGKDYFVEKMKIRRSKEMQLTQYDLEAWMKEQ